MFSMPALVSVLPLNANAITSFHTGCYHNWTISILWAIEPSVNDRVFILLGVEATLEFSDVCSSLSCKGLITGKCLAGCLIAVSIVLRRFKVVPTTNDFRPWNMFQIKFHLYEFFMSWSAEWSPREAGKARKCVISDWSRRNCRIEFSKFLTCMTSLLKQRNLSCNPPKNMGVGLYHYNGVIDGLM